MAPPRLPPDQKMRHVGVSVHQRTWQQMQFIASCRQPRTSASAIVREAIAEYLARRVGPSVVADEGAA